MAFPEVEVRNILQQIEQQSATSQNFRCYLDLLLRLYRKIFQAGPYNNMFTRISIEKVHTRIWSKSPVMKDFMLKTGWKERSDYIEFTDDKFIRSTIELLADARISLTPSHAEWIAETKVENINAIGCLDSRETYLRKQARKRREKECTACLEDKEQRRLLGGLIQQEIRSDAERRKLLRNPC